MSLATLNPELNDVFETMFPPSGRMRRLLRDINHRILRMSIEANKRLCKGTLVTTERIIEYPQVFRWIRPQGSVLDIGCSTSRLPIELASLGYKVHGLDIRPYPFHHENFVFVQSNLFTWDSAAPFAIITAVSSIEHFGIGSYGDPSAEEGDHRAIEKIKSLIKPNGQFLLSVPFGSWSVSETHRVYDLGHLQRLLADFAWIDNRFFRRHNRDWIPCKAEDLKNIPSDSLPLKGVVLLNLTYPKQ